MLHQKGRWDEEVYRPTSQLLYVASFLSYAFEALMAVLEYNEWYLMMLKGTSPFTGKSAQTDRAYKYNTLKTQVKHAHEEHT
jgi:hypothetical protein